MSHEYIPQHRHALITPSRSSVCYKYIRLGHRFYFQFQIAYLFPPFNNNIASSFWERIFPSASIVRMLATELKIHAVLLIPHDKTQTLYIALWESKGPNLMCHFFQTSAQCTWTLIKITWQQRAFREMLGFAYLKDEPRHMYTLGQSTLELLLSGYWSTYPLTYNSLFNMLSYFALMNHMFVLYILFNNSLSL